MMDYIWIVLLLLLGIAMIIKPELLWKMEHIFTVKNGEPTELYLTLMRLGGIFFSISAVICFVYSLLHQ